MLIVTPHVGVWIETEIPKDLQSLNMSHLM